MEARKEAVLKRLAERNEQRILKSKNERSTLPIDIDATEKAFRAADASEISMKTPIKKKTTSIIQTNSPIVSFDEKAEQQLVALATWSNTMLDLDESEEFDLGSTKIEACRRIQKMLLNKKKLTNEEVKTITNQHKKGYGRYFEKTDPYLIRKKCQILFENSEIKQGVHELIMKKLIEVRTELAIYSDLSLQTSLLRIFLSIHPVWLKTALETIFSTEIETNKGGLVKTLSNFIIDNVFKNQNLLKNKKYAIGSGKPIITNAGKEALHNHFLAQTLKICCFVELAYSNKIIKNLCRIFTRWSNFKSFEDIFVELSKEILSGSSISLKKACAKFGFHPSYKQSFLENYDYTARSFEDFSNGLILAKLIETVGELKHGSILKRLRDPAGDRIRKLTNVKIVLEEMEKLGISTQDVTAASIVGGKKAEILSILWSIVGVKVCSERKERKVYQFDNENKQNSESQNYCQADDMILKICLKYGEDLNINVPNLESIRDGRLLSKAWNVYLPSGIAVQFFPGETIWEKIVSLAESEMKIAPGIDQHLPLFVKIFFERLELIRLQNSKAEVIQKTWRNYKARNKEPKLYEIVKILIENQRLSRCSISSLNNATFVVSRDSINSLSDLNGTFKVPKTPCRMRISTEQLIEEEEKDENEEPIIEEMNSMVISTMVERKTKILKHSQFKDEIIIEEDEDESIQIIENTLSLKQVSQIMENNGEEIEKEENETVEIKSQNNSMNEKDEAAESKSDSVENYQSTKFDTDFLETNVIKNSENLLKYSSESCHFLIDKNDETENEITEISSQPNRSEIGKFEDLSQLFEENKMSIGESLINEKENEQSSSQTDKILENILENQEKYVEELSTTPELRQILRAKKKIAEEQRKIAKKLKQFENCFEIKNLENHESLKWWNDEPKNTFFEDGTSIMNREFVDSQQSELLKNNKTQEEEKDDDDDEAEAEKREIAAIVIQKVYKGYLTRKMFKNQIEEIKKKSELYNKCVNQEYDEYQATKLSRKLESAEKKLSNCSQMLSHSNLAIVYIGAKIIDRLTALLPDLLLVFVTKYDGLNQVLSILEVADRGMAYKKIIGPLFEITRRIFQIEPSKIDQFVKPLVDRLSSKMLHLMLTYIDDNKWFILLTETVYGIVNGWPTNQGIIKWQFYINKSKKKIGNDKLRLMQIEKIEKLLINSSQSIIN